MIPVVDNEIVIDKALWADLNATHTKEALIEALANTIIDNNLPMPMRKITIEDARKDFEALRNFDAKQLFCQEPWFTRYEYDAKWWFRDTIIATNNVGNRAADYFQQENRWKCDSINSPSPYRTWHSKRFLLTLLPVLWSMKFEEVNNDVLRSCIGLRKYIASQFRPSAAKAVYEHFNAKYVLDFSSGWGDRLTGFLASDARYYQGVDPNANLLEGYHGLANEFNGPRTVLHTVGGAENQGYPNRCFDLVFTSPPYFNVERYTQEENQSFKRYKKIDQWLEGFLFPSLKSAWWGLDFGGHMAINISDVYSGHTINRICDPMNGFIATLNGAEYQGAIGYEMRKRPNSGALKGKTGTFAEPIWIWRKT